MSDSIGETNINAICNTHKYLLKSWPHPIERILVVRPQEQVRNFWDTDAYKMKL